MSPTYYEEFSKLPELPPHNTETVIHFLRKFCPEGPWILISIVPDGKPTTRTFRADEWAEAADWVEERQGKENIYFHVNPMLRPLASKASKEDVARLAWLYVDIDPRVGEDIDDERARALRLLRDYLKKPSLIIDSGGGYQGFWRLERSSKLETHGDVARAQELERYNIQLEREFGGDHCHNIDRVMRLPGTINLPNARKRRKGRVPAFAHVVEWHEVSYPIEKFVAAPIVQPALQTKAVAGLADGTAKVAIPGNLPEVGVDELREWATKNGKAISDHCFALIATGGDPSDPDKYPSRSEALFKVCCDLVRAEVPDDMIFAAITGPNEIASSVREKSNWERYALRQIERAKEEIIDPTLRMLNEKHAVIADIGGKCRIISEVFDPFLGRPRISRQTFEDFRNRYCNVMVQVGVTEKGAPIMKPAGHFWINHPNRRQYNALVFAPGQEVDGAYNLWRGFSCASLPGRKHESFLAHVRDNVCCGNPEHYTYLTKWMARVVQHPDSQGEVAVVMRGKRGTGKSFFAKHFGRLFGCHYLQISDSKHLVGNFNAHLRDAVVVFGDEAFFAGDRKHESNLKTLVTEELVAIEGKGLDVEIGSNYIHLILASNENWVVPAGLDERRFFMLEVSEDQKQNFDYFKGIKRDLDDGGMENLLYFLLTLDLEDFNVRKVPQTGALLEQKILSMDPETEWFYECLWEGRLLKKDTTWTARVQAEQLYDEYIARMDKQRRQYRMNPTAFGRFIGHVMPKGWPKKSRELCDVPWYNEQTGLTSTMKRRTYVYHFPTIEECRTHWDRYFGGPFEWPLVEVDQKPLTEKEPEPY